jgi:hypothetical protein
MNENIKFMYIVLCFFIALGSYFLCHNKRDWGWLVGGMAFTVGADYFLVLHDAHTPGVAVFCFAHVCYITRANNWPWRYILVFFACVLTTVILLFILNHIIALAGLYAFLFGLNIYFNMKYKKFNYLLIMSGLILFALCDLCVMLFDIPVYFNILPGFVRLYPLIWIFYIPAQGLLSLSAVKFQRSVKNYG